MAPRARSVRRVATLAATVLAGGLVIALHAQQTSTNPPEPPKPAQGAKPAPTPAPAPPAPPARTMPPDFTAYQAATKITDPAAELAALDKVLADWPDTNYAGTIYNAKFTLLTDKFPDRAQEIATVVDQMIDDLSPSAPPESRLSTVSRIVSKLVDKKILLDKAQTLVTEALAAADKSYAKTRARGTEMEGLIALGRGDDTAAVAAFNAALAANPELGDSELGLGKVEAKQGHTQAALDDYMAADVLTTLKKEDEDAMRALYVKVHGSDAGLDAALDAVYNAKLPNPIKPTPYSPPAGRTNRVVLAELFTGAGCPPCVSADLALDTVMERYPADAVIAIAYHANIPEPDPMVVSGGNARRTYYGVSGVPTIEVDGADRIGGGSRDVAPRTYNEYLGMIDHDLVEAPRATVAVHATRDGDKITVTASAANVSADAKDARLQVVLVERELHFTGENGIRVHPMVVRGVAGEHGDGFAVKASGETSADYTFDLAAIKADVTKTLTDELAKRRSTPAGAAADREYRAEGHAMTAIDPDNLFVVAFVQDGAKHVLQAARVDVTGRK